MEHVKETLGNFDRGEAIPDRKITDLEPVEPEKTQEEKREALRKSLLVASLDNTFENFKPAAGTEEALATFKDLAEGKTEWKMLLCYGGVGNGKTYLCEAAAIELYKRGLFCRVLTMARVMRALKECMRPEPRFSYEELINNYCYADRLIIDDVGMGGSGSEWEYGQLEEIIVVRYHERLFTILTTNRDLTELPERVVSRFRDPDKGMIVLNQGEDFRQLKGKRKRRGRR